MPSRESLFAMSNATSAHATHSPANPPDVTTSATIPEIASAAESAGRDQFLLRGGVVDACFTRRSDVLLVTFDNLGTVGQSDPPQPWLGRRAETAGLSILGLMAQRKDWYRNEDTPRLIGSLADAGFFSGFRRVVFTGASMGGFAALTYCGMVPGSVVLAFSPQSSLAPDLVPFEGRYHYGSRKWDWRTPAFRDAAEAVPSAAEIYLIYDPFVAEDRAHALRLTGPHVHHLRVGHMGHRAIRRLKGLGMLQPLIETVAQGSFDRQPFATALRARRQDIMWQRAVLAEAERRGHRRLVIAALKQLTRDDPQNGHARRSLKRLRRQPA